MPGQSSRDGHKRHMAVQREGRGKPWKNGTEEGRDASHTESFVPGYAVGTVLHPKFYGNDEQSPLNNFRADPPGDFGRSVVYTTEPLSPHTTYTAQMPGGYRLELFTDFAHFNHQKNILMEVTHCDPSKKVVEARYIDNALEPGQITATRPFIDTTVQTLDEAIQSFEAWQRELTQNPTTELTNQEHAKRFDQMTAKPDFYGYSAEGLILLPCLPTSQIDVLLPRYRQIRAVIDDIVNVQCWTRQD